MKNPFKKIKKTRVKETIAKGVSSVHGAAHFTWKTMADITAASEASAVHKLIGKSRHAVIEDRHNKTEQSQQAIIDKYNSIKKGVNDKLDKLALEVYSEHVDNEIHSGENV